MEAFQLLSGDDSRIHVDDVYAKERGFERAIVYGGLMLAQLSYVLGQKIPGELGHSGRWQIDYRRPLYCGDKATLSLEVTHLSKAMGVMEGRFRITARGVAIATGKVQSFVPPDEIAEDG